MPSPRITSAKALLTNAACHRVALVIGFSKTIGSIRMVLNLSSLLDWSNRTGHCRIDLYRGACGGAAQATCAPENLNDGRLSAMPLPDRASAAGTPFSARNADDRGNSVGRIDPMLEAGWRAVHDREVLWPICTGKTQLLGCFESRVVLDARAAESVISPTL